MTRVRNLLPKVAIIIMAVTLLMLPACSDENTPGGSQIEYYTIADSTGDYGYPTPYAHYSRGPGYTRMQYVFETLVWKNATEFVPQLASEWSYNADENSYTFTLQENVKWHDGTDFTAADVVFTYEYTKEHPYQWVDNRIVESVEEVDEYTVKMYLSEPYAVFFQDVVGVQPIIPKHIWEDVTVPEEFLDPEAVIGTGPYKLADYSQEHGTYLYEANDEYYLGTPAVGEIRFVKVSSEMNAAALEDGTVDSASVPAEVLEDIEAAGFTVIDAPVSWNYKLSINHQKEPLSSKEFRQALAYAIDRDAIVEIVMRGEAVAGSPGIVPPTSVWYNPETPQYEYNPDRARELIEGLGYTLEGDFFVKDGQTLELSLIAPASTTYYRDMGQLIMQQLEEVGIDIDFQTLEAKTVDSKVGAWDFDLSLYGHGGLYEPSFLYGCILDDDFNSARYYDNAELTRLLQDQLTEMDPTERKDMVFQIQVLYAEDMPSLTLCYPKSHWAHDGSLTLYYTMDGMASGIPIPLNRMCFVK
jgi:peptide/nickel transport system substrate-binding protein